MYIDTLVQGTFQMFTVLYTKYINLQDIQDVAQITQYKACQHDESILGATYNIMSRVQQYNPEQQNVVFIFGGPGGRKGAVVDYLVSDEILSILPYTKSATLCLQKEAHVLVMLSPVNTDHIFHRLKNMISS